MTALVETALRANTPHRRALRPHPNPSYLRANRVHPCVLDEKPRGLAFAGVASDLRTRTSHHTMSLPRAPAGSLRPAGAVPTALFPRSQNEVLGTHNPGAIALRGRGRIPLVSPLFAFPCAIFHFPLSPLHCLRIARQRLDYPYSSREFKILDQPPAGRTRLPSVLRIGSLCQSESCNQND